MKLNKKLWWLTLPTVVVAGTITTVLLVLPKPSGLQINSKYSKQELLNMERQIEKAYEVAAEDNYGNGPAQANSFYAKKLADQQFQDSLKEHVEDFDLKFSKLMEHSDTFEDRLEIANIIEEEAKDNDLSICSWEKIEDQKYGIMQNYIEQNLTAFSQKANQLDLNNDDQLEYREEVYEKAEAIGKQIDDLNSTNTSVTEFMLKAPENNALKQYMSKVSGISLNSTQNFTDSLQTKLQTRANYAFEDVNKNLTIGKDGQGNQYNLENELKNFNSADQVKTYKDDGENDASGNYGYYYLNENSSDGTIPYFNWNYKFWDSAATWKDENDNVQYGNYDYVEGLFNGNPIDSSLVPTHPMLGSNPALNGLQVRLAVQTTIDTDTYNPTPEVCYEFNPVDCTATYHLSLVVIDTLNTFNITDEEGQSTPYNYITTYPVDFTQPASRAQVQKYLIQQNKDVLNIDQTITDGNEESNAINNPVNSFQSLGVFFDKSTFTGEVSDGDGLLITPFADKYSADSEKAITGVTPGTMLLDNDLDSFFRVKINFQDIPYSSLSWSTKIYDFITTNKNETPYYDVDGKLITKDSKGANISITTLNNILSEIDKVANVTPEEYQGLKVIARVNDVTPVANPSDSGGTPVVFNANIGLYLRYADAQKGADGKYIYHEYPLLAYNMKDDDQTDTFKDSYDIQSYKTFYNSHNQTDQNFDQIIIPLHYSSQEQAKLNFCDNFSNNYENFKKLSSLALNLEDVGNKFYKIYDKHSILLPLYISSVAVMAIQVIIDGILLINYLIGLILTTSLCILQGLIVALDIAMLVVTAIILNTTIKENKVYDAEKDVWDKFLPSYKQELGDYKQKSDATFSSYNKWVVNKNSTSNFEALYANATSFYANVIDQSKEGQSVHHNVDYLLHAMYEAFKPFDTSSEHTEYTHINISSNLEEILGGITDMPVIGLFDAYMTNVITLANTIAAGVVGCLSVAITLVCHSMCAGIQFVDATSNFIPLADLSGELGEAASAGITEPATNALTKMAKTAPFSVVRIILLAIILALTIVTMVIRSQLSSLVEEYTSAYK